MLTKMSGAPAETAAENQAMDLVMTASALCSSGNGMNRMEVMTVECRSGKYVPTFFFQSYLIPFFMEKAPKSTLTTLLLISACNKLTRTYVLKA